jgi:tetratricopeptide (TPR) repeat protein
MYQERAGRTAEAAAVRKELAGLAEAAPGNYQTTWIVFRALMFADRPADAVKVLEGTADHAGVVARFEVMCQQGRYAEALAFIEGRMPGAGPYRLSWNVTRARALAQVGDTAKLRDVLAALKQEHVDPDVETNWPDLIEQVTAVGLRDALADQVATLLSSDPPVPRAGPAELFAKLYPKAPLATETWWRHFRRQNPGESPRATLDRLPALCDARLAEPAGKAALEAATAAARALPPAEGERWLRGLGEACLAAGMVEPARKHFEEATRRGDTPEAWQRLGEVLAEQGHWADAEAAFDKAWQKDRKQPLPLFQRCWAKIQRGGAAAAEGRRDLALAHLLPLGNELDRGAFVEELAKRSADPGDEFAEAARQERRLVVQAAMLFSIPGRNAQRQLAGDPRAFADRSQVVDATERLLLRMLRTDTYYYRAEGYLAALTRLHAERARSLLAKGDAGGALREAVAAQELVPTQATVAQQLVPEFEKAGHKELADRLYAAAAAGQDKLLADHPNSAVFRNNRAWLAATCNRDLEAALAHARKAVELLPDNPGHLDTLAEVHFRRGETGQAVERMKQCLSVDPRNAYYARQLKRFEAGDRSAPVPER